MNCMSGLIWRIPVNEYTQDRWAVIEIAMEGTAVQRILSAWYGGWAGSDSWRLSSGITEVEELEDSYIIKNHSGSVYICFKNRYGMSIYTSGILEGLKEHAVVTMVERYEQ